MHQFNCEKYGLLKFQLVLDIEGEEINVLEKQQLA